MNDSPIRSYTTMRSEDGELTTVDTTEWAKQNYFVNLQKTEEEDEPQEVATAPSMKRARRKKPPAVSKETPKPVGDELVAKAQKKDLRKRGLA